MCSRISKKLYGIATKMTATNLVLFCLYSPKSMHQNEFAVIPLAENIDVKSKAIVTKPS